MAAPGLPEAVRQPRVHPSCQACITKKKDRVSKRLRVHPVFLRRKKLLQSPMEILLVLSTHPTGRPPCRPFLPAQVDHLTVSSQASVRKKLSSKKDRRSVHQQLLFFCLTHHCIERLLAVVAPDAGEMAPLAAVGVQPGRVP
jgi:hypothetical protein